MLEQSSPRIAGPIIPNLPQPWRTGMVEAPAPLIDLPYLNPIHNSPPDRRASRQRSTQHERYMPSSLDTQQDRDAGVGCAFADRQARPAILIKGRRAYGSVGQRARGRC